VASHACLGEGYVPFGTHGRRDQQDRSRDGQEISIPRENLNDAIKLHYQQISASNVLPPACSR
jgi:hypothetical protein